MITSAKEYYSNLYRIQDENPPTLALLLPSTERIYNINRHIPNLNQNNDFKGYLLYEMKDYYIQTRGKVFK